MPNLWKLFCHPGRNTWLLGFHGTHKNVFGEAGRYVGWAVSEKPKKSKGGNMGPQCGV